MHSKFLHNMITFVVSLFIGTFFRFSSVAQLCPNLGNPMDCRIPGFPVHHQLPDPTQTHVHPVGDAIQPSHPLSSPSHPAFNLSQHQSFPMSQFFASGGQSIGVSASASFLPVNIQDWLFFFLITVLVLIYVQFCQVIFLHLLKCSYGCFSPNLL